MIDDLIKLMLEEYLELADSEYRELVHIRYQMDVSNFLGVRTPAIRKVANQYFREIKPLDIEQRLQACEELLARNLYELKIAAFRWAYLSRNQFRACDFPLLAGWLAKYVDDWIDGDDFCIHVLGEFFLRFPEQAQNVQEWTESTNRWMRRGAAVSLILPARRGEQLPLVFQVANRLMGDEDDLVVKGFGWMLKETSKQHPDEVFEYVVDHRAVFPRTALRYAIEKLPDDMRHQAMSRDQ
jgi:3-methyladenine DNA glycosylase AlkD